MNDKMDKPPFPVIYDIRLGDPPTVEELDKQRAQEKPYVPEYRQGNGYVPQASGFVPRKSLFDPVKAQSSRESQGKQYTQAKMEMAKRKQEWKESESKLPFHTWFMENGGMEELFTQLWFGATCVQFASYKKFYVDKLVECFVVKPKAAIEVSTPQSQQVEVTPEELLALGLQANGINVDSTAVKKLIKDSTN